MKRVLTENLENPGKGSFENQFRGYTLSSLGKVPHFPHIGKIVVDSVRVCWQNSFCCFDVRRYLSWIEGLTTNQYVGGSNPSRRTILLFKTPLWGVFCFFASPSSLSEIR